MKKVKDLTGQKFGRLTVIRLDHRTQKYGKDGSKQGFEYFWLCKCGCGSVININGHNLKNGTTKSCGCLQREIIGNLNKIHAKSNIRLYKIWLGMCRRCKSKNRKEHKYYRDRGIVVCEEWKNDFMAFYNWAINNGYKEDLTIDRIDNNGNYEPNNCRWATVKEQCNNRRTNRFITYNNQTHTLTEWAEILGIKERTLNSRLNKLKWTIEKAFNAER